jgi:hypothetical protein
MEGRDKEPSINITNVFLLDRREKPLKNMDAVTVEELEKGIHVDYEGKGIDMDSIMDKINPATCFVTLDIPFIIPFTDKKTGRERKDDRVVGFNPLILEADLRVKEDYTEWKPEWIQDEVNYMENWLYARFAPRKWPVKNLYDKCVLAHLTLKGNFTWDINDINTIRDGRHAGDFEMWFWIVKKA